MTRRSSAAPDGGDGNVNAYRPLRLTVVAIGVFAVLFLIGGSTGWWTPADNEPPIGEVSRWCERVDGGLFREPINTLGNLGFVVSGLAMFVVLARETTANRTAGPTGNRFTGNQPIALTYAAATVFLGPGSMLMHGSHTFFGAWIDNVSMVAYILIPWMVNVAVLRRSSDRGLLTAYGLVLGAFATSYWFFGGDLGIGLDLFGLSIALWMVSEALFRFWSPAARVWSGLIGFGVAMVFGITPVEMFNAVGDHWWVVLFWVPGLLADRAPMTRRTYTPWFWAGTTSFLLAFAIWTTGTADHSWCRPDGLVQAHAVWHLLTAFSTWCFFQFLRTERRIGDGRPVSGLASTGRFTPPHQ
ncbi:MAG: ceramidase domain-containing protein [Acidimicrobiia bacterium]|nr:ceramidase domain-containing protein [Acidimicrobiia bacterium]